MRASALFLLLFSLACDQRRNYQTDRRCTCNQPDGGTSLATSGNEYCDQPTEIGAQACHTQPVYGSGSMCGGLQVRPPAGCCVSLTDCTCELSYPDICF